MSKSLRVAIDARTLQARRLGGVGRSLANLLPCLAADAEVELLVDGRRGEPQHASGLPVHSLRAPLSSRGAPWLQLTAARWLRGYDGIFHCPFYGLPYYQAVPMVVTIHDLTFEFAPEWYGRLIRASFRRQARWAARTAQRIVAPSEHVRTMLLERYARYGATDDQVVVVGWPVDPLFRPEPDEFAVRLDRLGLSGPYVVALGGAGRRQLGVAVEAWAEATRRLDAAPEELPLVVVGTEAPAPRAGVRFLGPLSDRDWAATLAGARAFCYPTLYEGYGLPAIEAAASGVPVVCARVGSLPEVLGDGAAWSEAPDAGSLAVALAGVLADESRAERLSAAALERARALPSAEEAATEMLRAYRDAAGGCHHLRGESRVSHS